VKKKRVPAAGTKLPKQVNKERYAAIATATLGMQGGVGLNGFTLESAEQHKELVRKMTKLYFEEEPGKPAMAWVLVNLGWNDGFEDEQGRPQHRICGYYYDEAEYSSMPTLGGYVTLEEWYVCTVMISMSAMPHTAAR
jgi:hypothetical protein